LKAISKLGDSKSISNSIPVETSQLLAKRDRDYVFIKADRQNVKVYLDEILYIESLKNHVKVVLPTQRHITLVNMQDIEKKLDNEKFVRVHRSFIVALSKIKSFNSSGLYIADQFIPIGRSYKLTVMERLNKFLL